MATAVASRLRAPRRVPAPTIPRRGAAGFDHSRLARTLAAATDGWRVDYGAVARSSDLAAYRRDLAAADPVVARPRRAARVLDQRLQRVDPRASSPSACPCAASSTSTAPSRGSASASRRSDVYGRRDRARDRAPARRRPRPLRAEQRLGGRPAAARLRRAPGAGRPSSRRTAAATWPTSSAAPAATASACCSAGSSSGSPATSPRSARCPPPSGCMPRRRAARRGSYRRFAVCSPSAARRPPGRVPRLRLGRQRGLGGGLRAAQPASSGGRQGEGGDVEEDVAAGGAARRVAVGDAEARGSPRPTSRSRSPVP